MTIESPSLECDLVMKGGVTSGLVYPLAVHELAKHYRLRSVGGTSAGAIAAAAAACAELGRASGGFDRLAAIPAALAEPVDGATRLVALFEPDPSMRGYFAIAKRGLRLGALLAAVRHFPLTTLLATAFGLALFSTFDRTHVATVAIGALASALAAGLALAAMIGARLVRALPARDYGFCRGMARGALTPWLHATLQSLADRPLDRPVTFGDLGNHPTGAIDLRLVTTCLSHGRPYTFPLDRNDLHFDEAEMRALFPGEIVDHLIAHARKVRDGRRIDGRLPLPSMRDLPILVAVRMSLAFPGLIAGVPMYRWRSEPAPRLRVVERLLFVDGGLTSNFPIHFFDAPLPSRPTFGINLVDDRYLPVEARDPVDYVWMPETNGAGQSEQVVSFRGIAGYAKALLDTASSWPDHTQLRTPGYRDRIAHVRLARDEGGLNLAMSRERMLAIAERGAEAGRRLAQRFVPGLAKEPHALDWRNHRWVRWRSAMRLVERELAAARESEIAVIDTTASIDALAKSPPSYRFRTRAQAAAALDAYRALAAWTRDRARDARRLGHAVFERDAKDGPRPDVEMRIRPKL